MLFELRTILIVHDDADVLARLETTLTDIAAVSTATTFDEAKALVAVAPPAVLITGVRLGEYNGLHLIIRSRIDSPATTGIVISDRCDPGLVEEAAKYSAACLSYPEDEPRLLALVAQALATTDV